GRGRQRSSVTPSAMAAVRWPGASSVPVSHARAGEVCEVPAAGGPGLSGGAASSATVSARSVIRSRASWSRPARVSVYWRRAGHPLGRDHTRFLQAGERRVQRAAAGDAEAAGAERLADRIAVQRDLLHAGEDRAGQQGAGPGRRPARLTDGIAT